MIWNQSKWIYIPWYSLQNISYSTLIDSSYYCLLLLTSSWETRWPAVLQHAAFFHLFTFTIATLNPKRFFLHLLLSEILAILQIIAQLPLSQVFQIFQAVLSPLFFFNSLLLYQIWIYILPLVFTALSHLPSLPHCFLLFLIVSFSSFTGSSSSFFKAGIMPCISYHNPMTKHSAYL